MNSGDNNYSTLEEMKDYFVKKSEIVSNCLKYRAVDEDVAKKYNSLELAISELRGTFKIIREELSAGRENVAEMQNLLKKVENLNDRLDHMENNFPSVLKQPTVNQEKKMECTSDTAGKENIPCEKKSNKSVPQMQYVTLQEFEAVPKYMKGRLKYEQINKFVDDFNAVIEKKYQLLKMPRKELKLPQQHIVQKLKCQENDQTKGLYFCTSEDMKEYGNIRPDKTTTSIMTILRHCLKMKEIRSPGLIRYAIVV